MARSKDVEVRARRGAIAYRTGLAAEETTARDYEARGGKIAARRWRGRSGEIDLIARQGDSVVFIEVKQARDFETAAQRLGDRQTQRLFSAAAEYLAGEPRGLDTQSRFDVALVDGAGHLMIMENALAA